jgi:hypothetical protein
VENLQKTLDKFDTYGLSKDADFVDMLSKMLVWDPKQRISP